MQKKQASLHLPLIIFCALLIGVVALSFLYPSQEVEEIGDPVIETVSVQNEIINVPPQISNPEIMQELQKEAGEMAELFEQHQLEEELFNNIFSIHTDLEPKKGAKVGINVVRVPQNIQKPLQTDILGIEGEPVKVAIIIDDMGISRKWSRKISELKGPLTLSYLPYAEDLQIQADYALTNNHHLMLHMPMQALGGKMEQTPGLLRSNSTQSEFMESFYKNLYSFEGFSGINNHMGSRLTRDRTKMNLVMQALKSENLYFIDSRTIHDSIAANAAEEGGVPYLIRDVFLDHEDTLDYARDALKKLERKALEDGVAIAIGHPKEATYMALKEWLPTLSEKNIQLVHAGDLIRQKYPQQEIISYRISPENKNLKTNSEVPRKAVQASLD